ncbi:MAG: anti-sigma regulatory factor [Cyanobacteria bacterium P01_F01_bin.150]
MIAIAPRPASGRKWGTLSFASTLHLCPILDLLLADVPRHCEGDLRLGLQEALVNASIHGNQLDPTKTVLVQFCFLHNQYWWIISDQGGGFSPQFVEVLKQKSTCAPSEFQECGRGLFIMNQVFDLVQWEEDGSELRLCKRVKPLSRLPIGWKAS